MFKNISKEGAQELYKAYYSNEYPIFFRHMEDFLNEDQFYQIFGNGISVLEICQKKIYGFLTLKVYIKPKIVEVGILLLKDFQKTGLALKAMKMILTYLLIKQGYNKVICTVAKDDIRSMELLKKGQFLPEARLKYNCYYDNKLRDELRWAMPKNRFKHLYFDKPQK